MSHTKTMDLLHRIGNDVTKFRDEIITLIKDKDPHELTDAARDLAYRGQKHLRHGRDYAASQLRHLRSHPAQSSAGIVGGLLLLGAVGAGIYYLCKKDCPSHNRIGGRLDSNEEENLPPYIS